MPVCEYTQVRIEKLIIYDMNNVLYIGSLDQCMFFVFF